MINLNYDIVTGLVTLAQPATIKPGNPQLLVQVNFSAAPGSVSSLQFALGTDSSSPAVLAFTDGFSAVNDTTWQAFLDTTDSRLAAAMSGVGTLTPNAELAAVVNGIESVCANLSVTVQQPIIAGSQTTLSTPTYLTATQTNTAITTAVAGAGLNATGALAIAAAGDVNLGWAAGVHNWIGKLTVGVGSGGAFTDNLVLQSGNRVAGDRAEVQILMPQSTNPTLAIRDTTNSGTILYTLTGDATKARTYLLVAYFDGANWQPFSLSEQV